MYCVTIKKDCPHYSGSALAPREVWEFDENKASSSSVGQPPCSVCGDKSENWVCLGCRGVFCSRYVKGHLQDHIKESAQVSGDTVFAAAAAARSETDTQTHCLAMSLSDLSVWCSLCDCYVGNDTPLARAAMNCIYFSKFGELPPQASLGSASSGEGQGDGSEASRRVESLADEVAKLLLEQGNGCASAVVSSNTAVEASQISLTITQAPQDEGEPAGQTFGNEWEAPPGKGSLDGGWDCGCRLPIHFAHSMDEAECSRCHEPRPDRRPQRQAQDSDDDTDDDDDDKPGFGSLNGGWDCGCRLPQHFKHSMTEAECMRCFMPRPNSNYDYDVPGKGASNGGWNCGCRLPKHYRHSMDELECSRCRQPCPAVRAQRQAEESDSGDDMSGVGASNGDWTCGCSLPQHRRHTIYENKCRRCNQLSPGAQSLAGPGAPDSGDEKPGFGSLNGGWNCGCRLPQHYRHSMKEAECSRCGERRQPQDQAETDTDTDTSSAAAEASTAAPAVVPAEPQPQHPPPLPVRVVYHPDCAGHRVDGHPEKPERYVQILKTLQDHYGGQGQGERGASSSSAAAAAGPGTEDTVGATGGMFVLAPLATREQALLFHTPAHWSKVMDICTQTEENYVQYCAEVQAREGARIISPSKQQLKQLSFKEQKRMRKAEEDAVTAAGLMAPRDFAQLEEDLVLDIDGDTSVMHGSRAAILRAAGSMVMAVDMVLGDVPSAKTVFCCVRPPGHHAETKQPMGFCFLNNAGIAAKYARSRYGVARAAVVDFDVHHGNGTEEGFTPDPTLFYGSTHEKDNFPGTGEEPAKIGDAATNPLHRRIVDRFLHSGPVSVQQFRQKWRQVVEEMIRFEPELIIISAGFDAHKEDPLGNCCLREDDFHWATRIVMEAAVTIRPTKPVPVISLLEGGYNIAAISRSALAHVKALEEGYPPAPKAGDEVAVLQRHMQSLGLGDKPVK